MNKLLAFFTFVFVCGNILSFSLEGAQGLAATTLSTAIDDDDTAIPVVSASGFLSSDRIFVDNEIVVYTAHETPCVTAPHAGEPSCFTGAVRGSRSTESASHNSGVKVFSRTTGVVNQLVGFNIAETSSTSGILRTIIIAPLALAKAVAKVTTWDYSFLEGDFVWIKYIVLYPLSAGFIWTVVILTQNMFMSIFRR
jgi:hypothetical protein